VSLLEMDGLRSPAAPCEQKGVAGPDQLSPAGELFRNIIRWSNGFRPSTRNSTRRPNSTSSVS